MQIPAEAVGFLKELNGMIATRDARNRPISVEAMILDLDSDSGVGEVAANARFARNMVEHLRDNGRFAYVSSRVWDDHRSVQIKGRCLDIRGPVVDPELVVPRLETLAKMLPLFGVPSVVIESWMTLQFDSYFMLRVQVEEVYDQTPGPGAGRVLK